MKHNKLAIIGVGNMAKAIITGITHSNLAVGEIILFDIIRHNTRAWAPVCR